MAGKFNPNDYVEVQQRINRFWSENPEGRINVDLLSTPDNFDQVVFKATVYKHKDNPHPDSTGIAAEEKGKGGMANSTSWHENGETSAIGRALANMGYATSNKDRPSREEMQKVERMSAPSGPITDAEFLTLVEKAGAVKERWQEAMDLAGKDQTRWDLIIEKAPSDAWRTRFQELRPEKEAA